MSGPARPRLAGPAEAAALAALHASAFAPPAAWSAPAIAGLLTTPGVAALLDAAGGFLMLRTAADEAEILTLAVAPAARRRGVGAGLLAAAQALAAARGAQRMLLEVAEANTAARALYRAAGFHEAGRRRAYYEDGTDALLLARRLSPCGSATP